MSVMFNPSGMLNISADPSDLPEASNGQDITSDALTRCKNLRINQSGRAITRDGSAKLNAAAIASAIWWIEEQGGYRYTFAGTAIYKDESSIETGLTSAQWAAAKYNSYNDTTEQVFALNGTDRKRVAGSAVHEWGLEAPADAPTLTAGEGTGLTGLYNCKYTYVRKVGSTVVAESNPSPSAAEYLQLTNKSLLVEVTAPTDAQVTHIRLYRTLANGVIYYRDQDIPTGTYLFGYSESFESSGYISGDGYKFTIEDTNHGTENTYTWESTAETTEQTDGTSGGAGGDAWYNETDDYYDLWLQWYLGQR
jgi:hypothetical protein